MTFVLWVAVIVLILIAAILGGIFNLMVQLVFYTKRIREYIEEIDE